jgi:hypothetical protein
MAAAASNRGSRVERRAGRQRPATPLPFPRGFNKSTGSHAAVELYLRFHSGYYSIKFDRPAGTCRFHQDSATSLLMTLGPMPVGRSVDAGLMAHLSTPASSWRTSMHRSDPPKRITARAASQRLPRPELESARGAKVQLFFGAALCSPKTNGHQTMRVL